MKEKQAELLNFVLSLTPDQVEKILKHLPALKALTEIEQKKKRTA